MVTTVGDLNPIGRKRGDNVLYAVPKPSSFGMEMCDRDFRLNTCIVSPAGSLVDLKLDTLTNKEVPWNELDLVGVYKDNGQGGMVACADQVSADASGILSVWEYCAKSEGSNILWEIRDGAIYVDPAVYANPSSPTNTERFGHRAYAVAAPGVPASQGGSIAIFDGYLAATSALKVEGKSPQASVMDPSTPAGPAGAALRFYVYHPAGSKLSHVLRLVTYRAKGTF